MCVCGDGWEVGWSVLCVVCFFCNIFELDLIAVYMTCNITYNVIIHVMDSKL